MARFPATVVLIGLLFILNLNYASGNTNAIKKKYSVVEKGKMSRVLRQKMADETKLIQLQITEQHYLDITLNPYKTLNDQERLASLSQREIFILVDKSGSMTTKDDDPTESDRVLPWTRFDSALVAAQSLAEVALSIDPYNSVEILLWGDDEDAPGKLHAVHESTKDVTDIERFFNSNPPYGTTTPLAEALDEVYQRRMKSILSKGEPFTCIILTDGVPNDPDDVKAFFKKVVVENDLKRQGRQSLVSFSLVRIGDDGPTLSFLRDLDLNLHLDEAAQVDIMDTKDDHFVFATGKYKNRVAGPFNVFWDALFHDY